MMGFRNTSKYCVSILEFHASWKYGTHIHSRLVYVGLFSISVSYSVSFVDEVITSMSQGKSKDDSSALS